MQRTNDTFRQVDKFGTGKDGYTEGDPGVTGPTNLRADMMDHLQEEVARTVEGSGLALDAGVYDQVLRVLRAAAADTAVMNSYEEAYAGTISNNGTAAAALFEQDDDGENTRVIVHLGGEIQRRLTSAGGWVEQTSPTANNLHSVCSNGSIGTAGTLFVAVGASGTIITSSNGASWTSRTADGGYSGTFHRVFFGGLFVALGSGGEIQTSPDGITWTQRTAAGSYADDFRGGAYDGTTYVIVGDGAEIQTSTDAASWTQQTADAAYAGDFAAVAYGNDYFIAAGFDGTVQRAVASDVTSWTEETSPSWLTELADLVFFQGLFTGIRPGEGELAVAVQGDDWRRRAVHGNGTPGFAGVAPGELIIPTTNVAIHSRRVSTLLHGD